MVGSQTPWPKTWISATALSWGAGRLCMILTVRVPGELPPQLDAVRRQQARWAQGSTQVAVKTLPALLGSDQPLRIKLEGLLHLTGYLVHPLLIVALLLGIPLAWAHGSVAGFLPRCALATIAPSIAPRFRAV